MLYYTRLLYTILYCTVLYYTTLHYTVLYYTILYYTTLNYTVLYNTIQYNAIQNNTTLYYTTLYYHHHISVMELGHLLTRSGLTYPETSSKVCHDSFCQLGNSVSLPWVIYYGAFYLHVVFSFSCIPVICLKLVYF